MNKKKYIILFVTILIFVGVILYILFKDSSSWTNEVLNSDSYEIKAKDCNGKEINIKKEILNEINKYWPELIDNGPWTGNQNMCYKQIIISYDNNNIIEKKEISIIDNSSIIFTSNGKSTYYINANKLIFYLNNQI